MILFTMFFNLLMLPFTLLGMGTRILFGMLGLSTGILLWPLKIFARHTVLCIVVILAIIMIARFKSDPHSLDQLTPAPATQQAANNNGGPPVIEAVTKTEDGDSAFATDLYASMTDGERSIYSRQFFAIMNSAPSGQTQTWENNNIAGAIQPTDTFKNKTGSTCRHFRETLKVHKVQQNLTGIACVQASGAWCKLKPNATPSCGLGHKAGMFDGIKGSISDLF